MTKIEAVYCGEADITFIMEYTYKNDELVKEEVRGFYHGEPDEESTELYYGDLDAEF